MRTIVLSGGSASGVRKGPVVSKAIIEALSDPAALSGSELRIQIRRDSTENWGSENPVLYEGELGVDLSSKKIKLGDGATAWADLPFMASTPAEVSAEIASALTAYTPTAGLAAVAFTGSASSLIAGTLADIRLSSNVPLKNGNSVFTGGNTFQATQIYEASICFGAGGTGPRIRQGYLNASSQVFRLNNNADTARAGLEVGDVASTGSGTFAGNVTISATGTAYADILLNLPQAKFRGDARVDIGTPSARNAMLSVQIPSGSTVSHYLWMGGPSKKAVQVTADASSVSYGIEGNDGTIYFGNTNVNSQQIALNTATGAATFSGNVSALSSLTVGDGTAYGVAFKGNITGSRIALNSSGMKAMYSYADAGYAGWVNNNLSTGEYYYFGAGGHYFGHNGVNFLSLTGSGATFSVGVTLASSSFIRRTDGNFLLGWDAGGDYVAAGSNFGTARPLNIGGHHTDILVRNAGTVRSKWFANGNFQVGNLSDLGTLFQVAGTSNIQGAAQFGSTLSVTGAGTFSSDLDVLGQTEIYGTAAANKLVVYNNATKDYVRFAVNSDTGEARFAGASGDLYIRPYGGATSIIGNYLTIASTYTDIAFITNQGGSGTSPLTLRNSSCLFTTGVWHKDSNESERFYYASGGPSYYKGAGTGIIHEFRNSLNTALARISNEGELRTTSAIAANNGSANVAALGSGIAYYGLGHAALFTASSGVGPQIYLGDSNFGNSAYWNSAPGIGAVVGNAVTSDLAVYVYTGSQNARSEAARFTHLLDLQVKNRIRIGDTGPHLKNSSGELHVRNNLDTSQGDVVARYVALGGFTTASYGTKVLQASGDVAISGWGGNNSKTLILNAAGTTTGSMSAIDASTTVSGDYYITLTNNHASGGSVISAVAVGSGSARSTYIALPLSATWSAGVSGADGSYKVSYSSAIDTNVRFSITSAGNVTIPVSTWIKDSATLDRIQFIASGATVIRGHGTNVVDFALAGGSAIGRFTTAGLFSFGNISASGSYFLTAGTGPQMYETSGRFTFRNNGNTDFAGFIANDSTITSSSGGSIATPAVAGLHLRSALNSYSVGGLFGSSYASNSAHGDIFLWANPLITTADYSNRTEDLAIRGNSGNVEIRRGRLVLVDTVNASSWGLKTQYSDSFGQLDFVNHSNVTKMTLSQAGRLTLNGSAEGATHVGLIVNNIASNATGLKTQILLPVFNGSGGGVIESVGNSIDGYRMNFYHAQPGGTLTFGTGGDVERMRIDATGLVGLAMLPQTGRSLSILPVNTSDRSGVRVYDYGGFVSADAQSGFEVAYLGGSFASPTTTVAGHYRNILSFRTGGSSAGLVTLPSFAVRCTIGSVIGSALSEVNTSFMCTSTATGVMLPLQVLYGNSNLVEFTQGSIRLAGDSGVRLKNNTGLLEIRNGLDNGNASVSGAGYYARAGGFYLRDGSSGSDHWRLYKDNGDNNAYFRDVIYNRNHVTFIPGVNSSTNGTHFHSRVLIDDAFIVSGGAGIVFSGSTPVVYGASAPWMMYSANSANTLYLRDATNGRMHATYVQGASSAAATTTLHSRLNIDGQVRLGDTVGNYSQMYLGKSGSHSTLLSNGDVDNNFVIQMLSTSTGALFFDVGTGGIKVRPTGTSTEVFRVSNAGLVYAGAGLSIPGSTLGIAWNGSTTDRLTLNTGPGGRFIIRLGGVDVVDIDRDSQLASSLKISAGNSTFAGHITSAFQSLSADPSTLDISAGMSRLVKNTTSGEVRHWVNDGGTMKKSPAYT